MFDGINMSNSRENQEMSSNNKRVVCVGDRVLRNTGSPSPSEQLAKYKLISSETIACYFPDTPNIAWINCIVLHLTLPDRTYFGLLVFWFFFQKVNIILINHPHRPSLAKSGCAERWSYNIQENKIKATILALTYLGPSL